MSEFYEVCKTLISTDTFNKNNSPYVLCTAIDLFTQNSFGSVEFDYGKIYDREDKYKDVVGFYHTHPPKCFGMSSTDVNTMEQWVKCLGKSLICLIECDGVLNAWIFSKGEDGKINHAEIKADTTNNVNYYVWTEPTPAFWGNADFLIHGEGLVSEEDQEDPVGSIIDRLDSVETGVASILVGLDNLTGAIQSLITAITKEDNEPRD